MTLLLSMCFYLSKL